MADRNTNSAALCVNQVCKAGAPKIQGGSQGGQPLWLVTTRTLLLKNARRCRHKLYDRDQVVSFLASGATMTLYISADEVFEDNDRTVMVMDMGQVADPSAELVSALALDSCSPCLVVCRGSTAFMLESALVRNVRQASWLRWQLLPAALLQRLARAAEAGASASPWA